jgi:simple sugar transport system permease protein
MNHVLTLAFVAQVLRITVPYVLAALGGTLSERSGVINLALEGMLLAGAFAGTVGAYFGGSPVLAVLCGVLGGALIAGLYALLVVRFHADQVVCGVALNLLVMGLTRYGLKLVFHSASSSPTIEGFGFAWSASVFVGLSALAIIGVHVLITHSVYGLRLRAVGEHPRAAASLGVSVPLTRGAAVLLSGVLAGLGGAWLALDNHGFVDRMSGGRGYLALAAMIFGAWRPLAVSAACLLFGFADALQLNLQASTTWPRELVQILPYVLTLVVLAFTATRARAPAALGKES